VHVHVEHPLPLFERGLDHRRDVDHPGAVDQDLARAEARLRLGKEALDRLRIGHIALHRTGRARERDHARATFFEQFRGRPPDPGRGPRHDRHFPVEFTHNRRQATPTSQY
jgi:hypothetical protein